MPLTPVVTALQMSPPVEKAMPLGVNRVTCRPSQKFKIVEMPTDPDMLHRGYNALREIEDAEGVPGVTSSSPLLPDITLAPVCEGIPATAPELFPLKSLLVM